MMGMKANPENGKRLFDALRELEIQFLNGGYSVQTSLNKLLKSYKVPYVKELTRFLIEQSIVKKDEKNSKVRKPFYWYNGEKLTVKYCNSLILQMKLGRSADAKASSEGYILKSLYEDHKKEFDELEDRYMKAKIILEYLEEKIG